MPKLGSGRRPPDRTIRARLGDVFGRFALADESSDGQRLDVVADFGDAQFEPPHRGRRRRKAPGPRPANSAEQSPQGPAVISPCREFARVVPSSQSRRMTREMRVRPGRKAAAATAID